MAGAGWRDAALAMVQARAVRIGVLVVLVTGIGAAVWVLANRPDLCAWLGAAETFARDHAGLAFLALFIWSACVFLTLAPLGTSTLLIASYLLGPMAGVVQFGALVMSSAILFEVSRERSDRALEARLEPFPRLNQLAGLARRNGLKFAIVTRVMPVIPSAGACLGAAYFNISRRDFYLGTLVSGWVRPAIFAVMGASAAALPVCGG
ncbi:MAG: VTT domain-containing protein [Pseudomonadota bacterium]